MPEGAVFLLFVIAQRLGELFWAQRNQRRLMARGATEVGGDHYPVLVVLHTSWLGVLCFLAWDAEISWPWLAIYLVVLAGRMWTMLSLGHRWTTRIVIIDEPLVCTGPYRFVRHPNYIVVVAEFIVVPMVLGNPWVAVLFSAANGIALAWRIRVENEALRGLPKKPDLS